MAATASRGDPDLVSDLIWLRKGPGLTLERLAQAGAVLAACGNADVPLETAHERFLSALRSMSDAAGGRALWAAYGISDNRAGERTLLQKRRAEHAATVHRSPDTVQDWEDVAVQELALRLLSCYYAGAPLPSQLPIPHGGLLLAHLSVESSFDDRRFVESHQERSVISLVEGAPYFVYGTYSPTELDQVQGGVLGLSKQAPGGTLHRIDFDPPLKRGELRSFGFREREPDGTPVTADVSGEDFSGQSFESPTLQYRVELLFRGEHPVVLWAYDKLSRIERPGEPGAGRAVALNEDGRASASFADLYGGLYAGVAWRWK